MNSVRNTVDLFSTALVTDDFTEYYRELAELTPRQFEDFMTMWMLRTTRDETFEDLPVYQRVLARMLENANAPCMKTKYNILGSLMIPTRGRVSSEEVIDKIFTKYACPGFERQILYNWCLRDMGRPSIDYRAEYNRLSEQELSRLVLIMAVRHKTSLEDSRELVKSRLGLDK